jgi:hypothetical protein
MLQRVTFLLSVSAFLAADVVRLEVTARTDVFNGRAFGLAGAYERITGKVHFAVDPANPRNQIIADIDKAPRNAQGKVEFAADLYLLQPKNAARSNGAVLFEVSNRGGRGMFNFFQRGAGGAQEADPGDAFLLRQGYTLAWVGWQPDVPERPGALRLYAPVLKGVRGLVRADFVVTQKTTRHMLSDRNHIPYRAADPQEREATLTVRDRADAPRQTIPRGQWRFSTDRGSVEMDAGFEPHRIYEVVYTGEDPWLIGLGPAAVRDFLGHMKRGPLAPLHKMDRAYAFGISQSGRFLRTFLYYGFNEDETGRAAVDGVLSHVAGGGRGSFNHRFAQPSRDAHPFLNFFYPTDIFPFTDIEQSDPETGLTDGLLNRARKAGVVPKIFYTNSSYEYWGRSASLIHTTIDGKADAEIPANTRIYLFAGGQHGPAPFPPRQSIGQQVNNPNDYRLGMRALLAAMDRWVSEGTEPPPSAYPRIADGTLATPEALLARFPKIPGVRTSARIHRAWRADYGPQWARGIVTQEPPKLGRAFPMLAPQVDEDGNELAGIKMPEVAVPLATYTGWNLFNEKSGPADEVSSMAGSYLAFARTRAERERSGDPRRSLEERYRDREQYLGRIAEAGLKLIEQRLLLREDLAEVVSRARRYWEHAQGGAGSQD